jgi:LDH2 family malate/lactate/ureidoglycolate dehydrogenase
MYPGQMEGELRRQLRETGIPIDQGLNEELVRLGESLGIRLKVPG